MQPKSRPRPRDRSRSCPPPRQTFSGTALLYLAEGLQGSPNFHLLMGLVRLGSVYVSA